MAGKIFYFSSAASPAVGTISQFSSLNTNSYYYGSGPDTPAMARLTFNGSQSTILSGSRIDWDQNATLSAVLSSVTIQSGATFNNILVFAMTGANSTFNAQAGSFVNQSGSDNLYMKLNVGASTTNLFLNGSMHFSAGSLSIGGGNSAGVGSNNRQLGGSLVVETSNFTCNSPGSLAVISGGSVVMDNLNAASDPGAFNIFPGGVVTYQNGANPSNSITNNIMIGGSLVLNAGNNSANWYTGVFVGGGTVVLKNGEYLDGNPNNLAIPGTLYSSTGALVTRDNVYRTATLDLSGCTIIPDGCEIVVGQYRSLSLITIDGATKFAPVNGGIGETFGLSINGAPSNIPGSSNVGSSFIGRGRITP